MSVALVCGCARSPEPELARAEVTIPDAPTDSPAASDDAPLPERVRPAHYPRQSGTGVAACDDFIEKYETCITTSPRIPDPVRDVYRQSIEDMRDAWREAASTPGGKAAAESACKQALEAMSEAMQGFDCNW
ncbi:hypothetical protein [Haliangium sp.]|uniref:hypothetical protein n=1 Tax=Haliangium sp. TaxID=2663208 RepID=UPI003D0B3960